MFGIHHTFMFPCQVFFQRVWRKLRHRSGFVPLPCCALSQTAVTFRAVSSPSPVAMVGEVAESVNEIHTKWYNHSDSPCKQQQSLLVCCGCWCDGMGRIMLLIHVCSLYANPVIQNSKSSCCCFDFLPWLRPRKGRDSDHGSRTRTSSVLLLGRIVSTRLVTRPFVVLVRIVTTSDSPCRCDSHHILLISISPGRTSCSTYHSLFCLFRHKADSCLLSSVLRSHVARHRS